MRILASNPDAIGDLVLRQPMYAALAAAGHELMFIVRTFVAPAARMLDSAARITCLDCNPFVHGIDQGWKALEPTFEAARAFKPELLLIAPYRWTLFEERLAEELPGVPVVAMNGGVYAGDFRQAQPNVSQLKPDRRVTAPEDMPEIHKNELLCSAVLNREVELPQPKLEATRRQIESATEELRRLGVKPEGYWAACVGHRDMIALRNWQPERWGTVLARWAEKYERRFLLIGDESESAATEEVLASMGSSATHVCNAIRPDSSLDTLIGLIHFSQGYIGRDTGPMHLAAALGKPVIAVFGGGHWPRFVPATDRGYVVTVGVPCTGCDWICQYADSHCVKEVPVERVWRAIENYEAGGLTERCVDVLPLGAPLAARMARESAARFQEQLRRIAPAERELGELRRQSEQQRVELCERAEAETREAREREALACERKGAVERSERERTEAKQAYEQERVALEKRSLQREATLRGELAALRGQVVQTEAHATDFQIELDELRKDQAILMRFIGKKIRDDAPLREEVRGLRASLHAESEENARRQARIAAQQQENEGLRETAGELERENRQRLGQIEELRGQIKGLRGAMGQDRDESVRLAAEVARQQQHVRDLLTSRWRKLGRRIGIARPAAWENGDGCDPEGQ